MRLFNPLFSPTAVFSVVSTALVLLLPDVHLGSRFCYSAMPHEPPSEYSHSPLSSDSCIRLVRIHTRLHDRRLSCTLEHFDASSDTCPDYVALSYVWGDAAPRHPIYINGHLHIVHTNLWLFLRRAWMNGAPPWFWIDSISLDQHSHSELNVQVVRMGDIYAGACHVISWLGESERGAEALNIMSDLLARKNSGVFGVNVLDMRTPAAQRLDRAWTQLVRQEGSEYWKRVWVLQEVACAKASSVVYGPVAMDFEELLQCEELESLYQFWSTGTQDGPFFVAAEWIGKLYALRQLIKTGGTIGLVDLLENLSGANSTRHVDRVYGLIGLCSRLDPDFDPGLLEIDYDKDLKTVAWDVILLTVETTPRSLLGSFHYTITRVFRALGIDSNIAPPRTHDNFTTTTQSRRVRTRRICQIYDAVAASDCLWLGDLSLEQVLHHVCTSSVCPKQTMNNDEAVDAIIALSLIICKADTGGADQDLSLELEYAEKSILEPIPRLCEAHLPQHLRRSVNLRKSTHRRSLKSTARVHQLQPVTTARRVEAEWSSGDALPRCEAGSSEIRYEDPPTDVCDESTVYLEIPELNLVLRSQLDPAESRKRKGSPGIRLHMYIQWFCTVCPLLWGAVDAIDQETQEASLEALQESSRPASPVYSPTPFCPETMASSSGMPSIPERSPFRARIEGLPSMDESNNRFLSSADFPWGRRPSLMDAWKEHRAKQSISRPGDSIIE